MSNYIESETLELKEKYTDMLYRDCFFFKRFRWYDYYWCKR